MGAGEGELRVGEGDGGQLVIGGLVEARMPTAEKVERVEIARPDAADDFFGLLFVLFEGRMGGKFRHTKLLSCGASGVRTCEAERRFAELWKS